MKYMLFIYGDPTINANPTPEQMQAEVQEYNLFSEEARRRNLYVAGEALHPVSAATTVRLRDGKTVVSDGPFAETREVLGGYYLLECKDLDEAIEMAAKIPGSRTGSIEIRPIVTWN